MSLADYKKHMSALANAAVNAVKAYITKNKISPGSALPQVREFQHYDSLRRNGGFTGTPLSVDGLWGPNSRTAAAWYLGKQVTTMPAVKPALAKTGLTWTQPIKAAVVAAVAGKPAAPKPAPKPAATAPTGPVTGYQQVGTEVNNPGLPPLGSDKKPVITVTPAGTHAVPVKPAPAKPKPKPKPKPAP